MHKFTIFTIIFSVVVIFIVADLVLNNYLGEDFADESRLNEEQSADEFSVTVMNGEDIVGEDTTTPEADDESTEETAVEVPETPASKITQDFVNTLGLTEPVLQTGSYNGLIYGFWDVSTEFANYTVFQHKVFDGSNYVATIYEVQTDSEVQTFDAYQTLITKANGSDQGEVNENNAAGEASFYFNHSSKTSTIFLTVQQNGTVYSFEYVSQYHAQIKPQIATL